MAEPWTPGPWHWENDYSDLCAEDNRVILWSGDNGVLLWADDADARLIAAAPEMAAFIASLPDTGDLCSAGIRADASDLLARIRGEA